MDIDELIMKRDRDIAAAALYSHELPHIAVPPRKETFESLDNDTTGLWVVCRKGEYLITYDDVRQQYGLAFRNIIGDLVYLGEEGGIDDAYDSLVSRDDEQGKKESRRR